MSNYTITVLALFAVVILQGWIIFKGIKKFKKIYSQKKSSEVKTGQIAENWAPFLKECEEFDPKTMKFMGDPIDFIVFDLDRDRIVFTEIKSGDARLSDKQKQIKEIIKKGNIEWKEVRIK